MCNTGAYHVNVPAGLLQWLNQQAREEEAWLGRFFVSVLYKISRHDTIRHDGDGLLHRRFWVGIEAAFGVKMLPNQRAKPSDVQLYEFFHQVAAEEGWLQSDGKYYQLTEKGRGFLLQPESSQIALVLEYVWPPAQLEYSLYETSAGI
ncbi:hypothetical protein B0H94_10363 [Salsuginibacillus halophilus]|uniref:Uncharacterized protein n=1 Tax=Salsuginibacillus halophilus TaxID=517424 RepID=A0A2P8HW39_9BACI|nr:hypothetical protein [Salsuginibacillus halophilus]PSL50452.1 hypothetical protein B0H94_10363 [Salsuginibacillus halophilus]